MTTYLNLYIILYVINLISLQYLIKNIFNNSLHWNSIPHMIFYITKFSKYKYIFYGLILALTGIPPFLLFFVKFNFLISTLSHINFFCIFIYIIVLYQVMIFYLQFFIIKNTKFDINYIKITKKPINFISLYIIIFFLFILIFSIYFFPDIYLFSNLITNLYNI